MDDTLRLHTLQHLVTTDVKETIKPESIYPEAHHFALSSESHTHLLTWLKPNPQPMNERNANVMISDGEKMENNLIS